MAISAATQSKVKNMAAAGWPVVHISKTLKLAMPTVQRVLQNPEAAVKAAKGEKRASASLKSARSAPASQTNTDLPVQPGSGGEIDQRDSETRILLVDLAASKTNTDLPVQPGSGGEIDHADIETPVRAVDLAAHPYKTTGIAVEIAPDEIRAEKRVYVTAKLRAQVINMLAAGQSDLFIEVATGLSDVQLERIKTEYQSAKADGEIDQVGHETQVHCVDLAKSTEPSSAQVEDVRQEKTKTRLEPTAKLSSPGANLSQTCLTIMELQARRVATLKALIQQSNATGAYVRRALGFSTDQDEKAREKLRKQAVDLIKAIEKGEPSDPAAARVRAAVEPFVLAAKAARQPFEQMRTDLERAMRAEAMKLPVWSWVESVKGFGALGLAITIGETGDLSAYATVSRVWKRLGLAVVNGKAQGRPGSGATAEDWIEHGYNRRRRSAMWTLADSLMKGNGDGPYRALYLARKEIEAEKAQAEGREMTKAHIHLRAQRYMEKRLIAHLWGQWHGKPEPVFVDAGAKE